MMRKCIMVKVGGSQKRKKNENREKFIGLYFAEVYMVDMQYASLV